MWNTTHNFIETQNTALQTLIRYRNKTHTHSLDKTNGGFYHNTYNKTNRHLVITLLPCLHYINNIKGKT